MAFVIRYMLAWLAAKLGSILFGRIKSSPSLHPALRWGAAAGLALVPVLASTTGTRKRTR